MPTQSSLLPHNQIIESYKNGKSVFALSKEYDTNTYQINNILNQNNVVRVSQAKRLNPFFKEDYFEIINSNEKAYLLGWILTDGCITKDNELQISLLKSDIKILQLFEKELNINNHIKNFCDKYVRFSVGSKIMCNDLAKYGAVPNKSHNLKFPQIYSEYEIPLLRGMFEGDGGLTSGMATRFYKHRNKTYTKPYQELSFTGTYDMCNGFQNVIQKHLDISTKNITSNHSVYRIRWANKEEIIEILDLLYDNCGNYFLERKFELYKRMKVGIENG